MTSILAAITFLSGFHYQTPPDDPRPTSPVIKRQTSVVANPAVARPKILLIPLDSRPAAGQFAQMIGAMAGVEIKMPPYETLGRFVNPGNVGKIFEWLESQKLDDVTAVIASADMLAYGGLIASRDGGGIDVTTATARLRRLINFKKKAPKHVKLYVFASTMRLTPTATKEAAPWRLQLARYEELKDRFTRLGDQSLIPSLERLKKIVPPEAIVKYEKTRNRNHEVQKALLRMAVAQEFDYLVMGQDDAKPDGPHIGENIKLKQLVKALSLGKKVFFCEGIDQHANILVSRALLTSRNWKPKVRVVYSDEEGKSKFANYESKTIEDSLDDQLYASGAQMAKPDEEFDYTLYLNTPKRRATTFEPFLASLKDEVDQGFPVAVADINFGPDGTSDPLLYDGLIENGRAMKLLSFAGWNTAGNTMGTAIPAANVFLFSRRFGVDPLVREVAKREFLLHRMVDDYAYHKFTRPAAYRMLDKQKLIRDEVYGPPFDKLNAYVRDDMKQHLQEIFESQFKDRQFFAGTSAYKFSSVEAVRVFLPWPRAYEARIEFKLKPEPFK